MKYIILGAAIAWAMYMADKYIFQLSLNFD